MLTGQLRSQIDRIWDAFWSGGISNPLEVIEQITYLLFIRRLDDLQTLEENKANRLGKPMERRIFPDGQGRARAAPTRTSAGRGSRTRARRDVHDRRRARLPVPADASAATTRPTRTT